MRSALVKAASVPVLALLIAATALTSPVSADTLNPYDATGTVMTSGQPAPNVPGATGSFVLGNLTEYSGNIGAAPGGSITVYVQPGSTFWLCDSNGQNCVKSTQDAVIVPGNVVYITGRYAGSGSTAEPFLNDAFTPPATPAPPPPADPQPTTLGDRTFADVYGVNGTVSTTSAPLAGSASYSSLWGFVLNPVTNYGCGTQSTCKVQQIAAAHHGSLAIDATTDTTTMWLSSDGGCTFAKSTDRYTVINVVGTSSGLFVSGHYGWDNIDWRFYATNIFAPAPLPPSSCPNTTTFNPLSAGGSLVEQTAGTYDPTTSTYRGSQWSGTMGPTGPFSNGTVSMTLDWTYDQAAGNWAFSGTWMVAAALPSTTSLSGTISGTSTMPAPPPSSPIGTVNSQVTVDQGTGTFAGYTGYGTWSGTDSFNPSDGSLPPVQQTGKFNWEIGKTS